MTTETVEAAQIVLPCKDLDATLAFFTERLGFRLETIHPADDPSVAVISGYGVRLELARGGDGAPGVLRLLCDDPRKVADGARGTGHQILVRLESERRRGPLARGSRRHALPRLDS